MTVFACIGVAACYAIGYAVAALRWHALLADIETTNVVGEFTALALLLLLFTPVADPARIAVADQMKRLRNGTTPPEKFDVSFLRFHGGRYRMAVLDELAASKDPSDSVAARAHVSPCRRSTITSCACRFAPRRRKPAPPTSRSCRTGRPCPRAS